MNLIEVSGITKTFGKKDAVVHALRGIELSIAQGEMVAIMGKSGSGKSTLLNILGGLMSMDSGEYQYDGAPVSFKKQVDLTKFRRDNVGFIVQYFALIEDLDVFHNVALPLRYKGYSSRVIKTKVNEVLDLLEMKDKIKAYPNELSGGQQQRTAIARALVKEPQFILADEPTGALDESTGDGVLEIFKSLHKSGKTIIIVTHDNKVAGICDRIITLRDGKIVDDAVVL